MYCNRICDFHFFLTWQRTIDLSVIAVKLQHVCVSTLHLDLVVPAIHNAFIRQSLWCRHLNVASDCIGINWRFLIDKVAQQAFVFFL